MLKFKIFMKAGYNGELLKEIDSKSMPIYLGFSLIPDLAFRIGITYDAGDRLIGVTRKIIKGSSYSINIVNLDDIDFIWRLGDAKV